MDEYPWIMSPQARRRLLSTMQVVELRDLAKECVRALQRDGLVHGDALAYEMAIYETLTEDA